MFVTYTGKIFDYNNITKDNICIEDIIHSLPRISRFIGHSSRSYTVAEHLLRCLTIADHFGYSKRLKLLVLVHDFTEAYIGDCPTPLKKLLKKFKKIENKIEKALYQHMEIEPPTKEEHRLVKAIDNTMLVIEMRDLTLHNHEDYIDDRTYMSIVDEIGFAIDKHGFSERQLQELLSEAYNTLLEGVKNG